MQKVITDIVLTFFFMLTLSAACFAYLEDLIDYGTSKLEVFLVF